jgi:DNA-binding LacI/PurR family transcriptional regulator
LTTIRMHLSRVGEVAARMLLDRLACKPVSAVVLPEVPELVVRGSTAPVKKPAQPSPGRTPTQAAQPSK